MAFHDKLRMKHTVGFTIKTILALAVVFGVIVYLISDHLIGLFTNDPKLIEMGSYILQRKEPPRLLCR